MTADEAGYFLFIGSVDSEAATTRLRASGARYQKKMLSSRPDNWTKIVDMVTHPDCRGALVVLTASDYNTMCSPLYENEARALLDALASRPHVVFVHEAVFFTEEQRAAAGLPQGVEPDKNVAGMSLDHDEYFEIPREDFFKSTSDEVRERVNSMLRERQLNVCPYRKNAERSIIASQFLEDNERHLLFRLYVPVGRLYAEEADALLNLFREWLGQTGRGSFRQEGYRTDAGQVFEFFRAEGQPEGGLRRYFEDFSSFLGECVANPDAAIGQLVANGFEEGAAQTTVSRYAIRMRRINLDLKQRREEKIMTLTHELEQVFIEIDGLKGVDMMAVLDELLPPPAATGVLSVTGPTATSSITVNNFSPQFIERVAGSVVQNIGGTVNLGPEAKQLLELAAFFGGNERSELETAIHELEDDDARGPERIAARGRLKRFLADLGNRGLGAGLDILQKYIEYKIGIA